MIDALPWDSEMESPATIAIIGAGPLGVEAALYARFLGYHVSIFEARRVAHRMLQWNDRPLDTPIGELTTSLGRAALAAQYPEYLTPDPTRIFTGKQYAEEYLLPLAKTDLLFDDIHFLSPVVDISRLREGTLPTPGQYHQFDWQDRCNDEFRILVEGRHRGTWASRADCIIDCTGSGTARFGLGPGGGLAIGESGLRKDFLEHLPYDRKFEPKTYDNRKIVIVGATQEACLCVRECLRYAAHQQLIWIVPPKKSTDSDTLNSTRLELSNHDSDSFVMIESLGVESIVKSDSGSWILKLLKDDESTVEIEADCVVSRTQRQSEPLGETLLAHSPHGTAYLERIFIESTASEGSGNLDLSRVREVLTPEPGYFRLQSAGGLAEGFERLRVIFAILGGRADLDLYEIMRKQSQSNLEQ